MGITISDYHEKLELLLHNGGRIEYICHSDDPLGSLYSMSDDSGEQMKHIIPSFRTITNFSTQKTLNEVM